MLTKLSKFWLRRDFKKKKKANLPFPLAADSLVGKSVDELIPTYTELMKRFNKVKDDIFRRYKKLKVLNGQFTQIEIESLKSKNIMHWFILLLFISAETGLYFFTSQLFVPNGSFIMKLVLSLFLALLVLVLLEWAFSQHFEYRYVLEKFNNGKTTKAELKNAKDRRFGGYLIAFLGFGIIISSGLVRIYYLEEVDLTEYTKHEIETMEIVSKWTSILTMFVTLALGIFLAFLKGEQVKNHLRFKEWKVWRYTRKKLNNSIAQIVDIKDIIDTLYQIIIEMYWQMMIELKSIYSDKVNENIDNYFVKIDDFSKECLNRAKNVDKIVKETDNVMKLISKTENPSKKDEEQSETDIENSPKKDEEQL